MKEKSNGRILFTISSILFLWAFLFILSLCFYYTAASVLAFGQVFFLLLNIPLGIVSLVRILKKRVQEKFRLPLAIVSVINILLGIADWVFLIMVLRMP